MSEFGSGRTTCDLCRSDFPATTFERTAPTLLEDQETVTVCPACRVVYNFDPDDHSCLECGAEIDTSRDSYRFDVEFPVNDEPDSPVATLAGSLCGECAGRLSLDVLFNGINCRDEVHERLLGALGHSDPATGSTIEQSRTSYLSGGSVR